MLSIGVIKHHGHGYLKKRAYFISVFQSDESTLAERHGSQQQTWWWEQDAERSHLDPQRGAEKEPALSLLKSQSAFPVAHILQQGHTSYTFPKKFHQLGSKRSNMCPRRHFHANHPRVSQSVVFLQSVDLYKQLVKCWLEILLFINELSNKNTTENTFLYYSIF